MTYGQLKLRLNKAFPGIDADLLEGWVNDRYQEILGEMPWSRFSVQAILQTTAPYLTGTVTLTMGSASVTGVGTAWAAGMSGLAFRATGRCEFYEFTYSSSTTATLDRPYEGANAAGAAYSIFQSVYPLPANCGILRDDAFASAFGEMKRFTHEQLSALDPQLVAGPQTPFAWAGYMDDGSTPPRMQVEIYPVPDLSIGIPYTYMAEPDDLTVATTILQIWMQPAALIEGATAKIKAHLKDYAGAQYHGLMAQVALKNMRTSEAQGLAPAQMVLDGYFTSHRSGRCR